MIIIKGSKIYLRELTLNDVSSEYCSWLNDKKVNIYLETRQCTIENLTKYIQKQISNKNSLLCGVFINENDTHIGNIKLEPMDWINKEAFFGIMIGNRKYWGQGIGSEAIKLTLDYAFKNLGFKEIKLGVHINNIKARKVFEKCGFKVVGIEKNSLNHDGVLYDNVIMAIKDDNY